MHTFYRPEDFGHLADEIHRLISEGTPFGVVRMPARDGFSDSYIVFRAEGENPGEHAMRLRVKPWLSHTWLDLSAQITLDVPPMQVCSQSTDYQVYTRMVDWTVRRLRQRGGKTVLARTVCGSFKELGIYGMCRLIESYFSTIASSTALTYLFWHPATGMWMGSTPELIMERTDRGCLSTMALAGTMPRDAAEPWSEKNIAEHGIVADYMERRLGRSGIAFSRGERAELEAAAVKHLCTRFNSEYLQNYSREGFDALVEAIQPTPALAGYPRREAIDEIHLLEPAHRYFYAGLINIADVRRNLTYGLIRCAHMNFKNWCVYTGSGITADSEAVAEWDETAAKASPLVQLLQTAST